MSDPRILYVHGEIQSSPGTGVHQRILNVGRLLQRCGPVTMVGIGLGGAADADTVAAFEAVFGPLRRLSQVQDAGPDRWWMRKYAKARLHWPWWTTRRVDPAGRAAFAQWRGQHDVIWFDSLDAADAVVTGKVPHGVVDIDDVNSSKHRLERSIRNETWGKLGQTCQMWRWRRRERLALRRFAVVSVCSAADRAVLGSHERIMVLPNGFDGPAEPPAWRPRIEKRLGFLGTLGYRPNVEGLEWFIQNVWPQVREAAPEVSLRVVGRQPAGMQISSAPGVEMLGWVDNVAPEMATWSALVVPLRFGGGTRIKIIEAWSRKCPVVSTAVGAYGLAMEDGRDLLLADTPADLAAACVRLLRQPELGEALAEAGWRRYRQEYTWQAQAPRVAAMVARAAKGVS